MRQEPKMKRLENIGIRKCLWLLIYSNIWLNRVISSRYSQCPCKLNQLRHTSDWSISRKSINSSAYEIRWVKWTKLRKCKSGSLKTFWILRNRNFSLFTEELTAFKSVILESMVFESRYFILTALWWFHDCKKRTIF